VDQEEGGYSKCHGHIVVTKEQLNIALHGKIPRIKLKSDDYKNQQPTDRPHKKRRDLATGLRIGTVKYQAYELWELGESMQTTIKKLKANSNSVRSWYGQFNRRYNVSGVIQ